VVLILPSGKKRPGNCFLSAAQALAGGILYTREGEWKSGAPHPGLWAEKCRRGALGGDREGEMWAFLLEKRGELPLLLSVNLSIFHKNSKN
jgi:hypothetical protein